MEKLPEKIHVAYGIISKTNQLAASLCSMFENTEEWVAIHIAHTKSLPISEKKKIFDLVRRYGQEVYFYVIEEYYSNRMKNIMKKARRQPKNQLGRYYIYDDYHPYRVLLGKILPGEVHRVVNLDADTIVNMDIKKLWEQPLDGMLFGACPDYGVQCIDEVANRCVPVINGDISRDRYFNAGIFLFDLDKIRRVKNFAEKTMQYTIDNYDEFAWIDQDAMNSLYGKDYKMLSSDYNCFVGKCRAENKKVIQSVIYHYADNNCGLRKDPYDLLYWEYYIKSGWFNQKRFLSFMNSMIKDYVVNILKSVRLISSREYKIYYGKAKYQAFVMDNAFQHGKDGYYLSHEEESNIIDLKMLLQTVESRGKDNCMIIILSEAYSVIAKYLTDHSFRENVDYFDGLPFVEKFMSLSRDEFIVDIF